MKEESKFSATQLCIYLFIYNTMVYLFIDSNLGYSTIFGGILTQWAFTCSKLTIETLEQGVEYVQS